MSNETKDHFKHKASNYENDSNRVNNVSNIGNKILSEISYSKDMHIMDFGAGTGMLLSQVAPYVNKITAIDVSRSMIETLTKKKDNIKCLLEIKEIDLSKENLDAKFDGIISSMTMHHIKEIKEMLEKFYNMLSSNGTIALSDLDKEDGTFHQEDTGVYHLGFDRNEFMNITKEVGFKNLKIHTVGNVIKPYGEYPVFLLTGNK